MRTILLVDDSKIFQRIMEKILSPHFQIVGKGQNGNEGIDLYNKLKPDLVFMDITMPNCNGKEALKAILQSNPRATVIMVSSLGDDQTVQECMKIGAKGFVPKDQITQADGEKSALIQTAMRTV
jgi:two-component system chemotaxis response regulator CheY